MTSIAFIFGLLVAGLGALGMVSPSRLLAVVRHFQTRGGLFAAAIIRIVLGTILFLAAPDSRAPQTLRIVGVFVFAAGLATPLMGVERARALLRWWSAQGALFVRAWAAVALLFGLALAYAVSG